jgi:catechol 2,3-dioxygenase-like lactoylglutathione lyase family enzyme
MDLVVNHVGLTVGDLDRSTAFYTAFGGEVVGGDRFDGLHMDRGLGLDGVDLHVRMVRFGAVILELLQYVAPPGHPWTGRNNDVGASHLAFTVDDIQAVHAVLVARGVEFYSEPIAIETGAFAGGSFVYAKDPDGVTVEFLQAGPALAGLAK